MYHIFFTHSLVVGHLGCFQVLVIINNAAMNMVEHISLWYDCLWGIYPTVVLLGLKVDCFQIF